MKEKTGQAHMRRKRAWPKVLLAVLLVLVVAAIGAYFIVRGEILGNWTGEMAQVSIEQGSSVATIAQELEEEQVIRFPLLFRWYVSRTGTASKLQYGEFTLEKGASYDAIIVALSAYAAAETTRLTFPEGTTAIAMAQKFEDAGLCTAEEFLEEANSGDFSEFAFWQYVPDDEDAPNRFMKCEGYLFPDTYEFLNDGTPHDYVATLYARFDEVIDDDIYDELNEQGMTLSELITLASFVQEEAGNDQNDNVAQVFRNRLADGSPYPMLQSNASSYIQNDEENNYLWNWVAPYYGGWDEIPENIIAAYDTYTRIGLPAGPISNPGLDAIKAALTPEPDKDVEDCYFFVTDLTGQYYYARTLAEHGANCEKAYAVNRGL